MEKVGSKVSIEMPYSGNTIRRQTYCNSKLKELLSQKPQPRTRGGASSANFGEVGLTVSHPFFVLEETTENLVQVEYC